MISKLLCVILVAVRGPRHVEHQTSEESLK